LDKGSLMSPTVAGPPIPERLNTDFGVTDSDLPSELGASLERHRVHVVALNRQLAAIGTPEAAMEENLSTQIGSYREELLALLTQLKSSHL